MTAEQEFEKWLDSKPSRETPFAAFKFALTLGRKSGLEEAENMIKAIDHNQIHRETKRCLLSAIRQRVEKAAE